ncbi:DUF397 domain-containing protein [Bailinhaonella thermotolerans]|uniref:DUF397 domain-containing protein n=1 Tax=Bailinhaonella thermotolerans TaxID=1070861 RepID=A0A3A4B4G6_9ACTN|nr:DUF397 domain-containing protein [Bailinhaonella thermotolerans]RJL33207.1 DUF397 domain-containing protein [Bailinhaonella thermotolerans]
MDLSRAEWRKSRRSQGTGNDCVEVADLSDAIAVRDSKNPDGGALVISRSSWSGFMNDIKAGKLSP